MSGLSTDTTTPTDDSRRLEAIQQELVQAWITHDRSILDRLLGPEWMVTHADGRMSTREEVLREVDSGDNRLLEGRVEDVKARVLDGFAVVTGRTYARREYKGHPYDVTSRFTDVFVRQARDGRRWLRMLVGLRRLGLKSF